MSNPSIAQSDRLALAASEARQISLILTTVYIAMLTLGCLHRTAPLYQLYKHGSFYCSVAFACVAVLQSIYQVRKDTFFCFGRKRRFFPAPIPSRQRARLVGEKSPPDTPPPFLPRTGPKPKQFTLNPRCRPLISSSCQRCRSKRRPCGYGSSAWSSTPSSSSSSASW